MAMIKLTGIGRDEGYNLFVNSNQIIWIAEDNGCIKLSDGDIFCTKETPEEILAKIKEAEAKNVVFCNNNVRSQQTKIDSRVQELIDQAHAADYLM